MKLYIFLFFGRPHGCLIQLFLDSWLSIAEFEKNYKNKLFKKEDLVDSALINAEK